MAQHALRTDLSHPPRPEPVPAYTWEATVQDVPGSLRWPRGTVRAPDHQAASLGHEPELLHLCETFIRTHPGGAEIELTLLFADVRGSTGLAERMGAMPFTKLLNRFYHSANRVVIDSDGLVDKLVGDEVIGLYLRSSERNILARSSSLPAIYWSPPGTRTQVALGFPWVRASTRAWHTSAPSAPRRP